MSALEAVDGWGIKVTNAEGEKQASAALPEAARMLAQQPEARKLRYLLTMTQVARDA